MSFYYDSPEYYDGEDYSYATAFDQPDVQKQLYGSLEQQVKAAGGTLGTKYQTPVGTPPSNFGKIGHKPSGCPDIALIGDACEGLHTVQKDAENLADKTGQASDVYGKGIAAALKNLSDQGSKAGQSAGQGFADIFGANIGGIPIIPILIGGVVLVFLLKK